jgi:outer membrane immunogenic protein
VAALSGSAFAADLSPRTYTKAPPPVVAPSWTGFYIFGGVGGGIWDSDSHTQTNPGGIPLSIDQRVGGDGWFGTVGAGYDWQFAGSWVAGVFADGQFGSLRGTLQDQALLVTSRIKMQDAWAAGVRLGYLVAPSVYSYVNAGYSGSHWSGSSLIDLAGTPVGLHTNSFNTNGWFVGGGVENNLNIFGITAPGLFTGRRSASLTPSTSCSRPTPSASSHGSRPSARRWSTASTGPARWSRSTDLTSISDGLKARALSRAFCLIQFLFDPVSVTYALGRLMRDARLRFNSQPLLFRKSCRRASRETIASRPPDRKLRLLPA